jgi:hypothetical protein
MHKEALLAKLADLKQQSESHIAQIAEHEEIVRNLRDSALIIKGKYQAIEEQLAELPDVTNVKSQKPVEGEVVKEK